MSMPDRSIARFACAALLGGGMLGGSLAPVFIVGIPLTPGVAAERFVDGFEDLPLMPSLTLIPEAAMAFDTVGGRIIVAAAEGQTTMDAVRAFTPPPCLNSDGSGLETINGSARMRN